MSRSVAPITVAGQTLYVMTNPGTTQLDSLLKNFAVLATLAAAPVASDPAPSLTADLDLKGHSIVDSVGPIHLVPNSSNGLRLSRNSTVLGPNAVDLQIVANSGQIAGGRCSFAAGANNAASADFAHAQGFGAVADQYGAHTEATSNWISQRAQRTDVSLCAKSTGGNPVSLSADGQISGLLVPANVTWLCEVHILAVMDYGSTSAWVLRFAVQNNGVNAHIVGYIKDEDDTSFSPLTLIPTPSGNALAKECIGAWVEVYTSVNYLLLTVRNPYEVTKGSGTSWHADFHITELSMVPGGGSGSGGTVI